MKKFIVVVVVLLVIALLFVFGRDTKLYKKMMAYVYGTKIGKKAEPAINKAEKAADQVKDVMVHIAEKAAQSLDVPEEKTKSLLVVEQEQK